MTRAAGWNQAMVVWMGLAWAPVAWADNEQSSQDRGDRDRSDWRGEDDRFDPASTIRLDYDAQADAVLVPAIGARWFGDGPGGALTVGMGVGGWQRWTPTLSGLDVGLWMLLYYEGYDGSARGRSVRMSSRFVVGGGPLHLKLGGDLGTSRHRFDFRPHLDGVLVAGPAADLVVARNGYGWVGGMALDYFLGGARPTQAMESPLVETCDEFSWFAGLAFDGSVWKYAQQWNAEGPMHLIVSTTLF